MEIDKLEKKASFTLDASLISYRYVISVDCPHPS